MADNTTILPAKSGANTIKKIFEAMSVSSNGIVSAMGVLVKKAWTCSGAPTVDAASQATYPVAIGDMLWDYTNSAGYTCTVAPTANTAGTFVKVHA
jgi:hypothetical protein